MKITSRKIYLIELNQRELDAIMSALAAGSDDYERELLGAIDAEVNRSPKKTK